MLCMWMLACILCFIRMGYDGDSAQCKDIASEHCFSSHILSVERASESGMSYLEKSQIGFCLNDNKALWVLQYARTSMFR